MPRAKLLLVVLLASGICAATAEAFLVLPNSGNSGIWSTSTVNIRFMFGTSPVLSDGSTWDSSAQAALDEWNAHMTVLQLTGTPVAGATSGGNRNSQNEAFFSPTVYGQAFGPNAAGITIISYSGFPETNTEADVIFNSAFAWDSYRGPQRTANGAHLLDFRRVALHEFGHLIGLDHADKFGATAAPAIMDKSTKDIDHLVDDDISGVRFLYGPGEPPGYADQSNLNVVATLGSSQRITFSNAGGTPFITYTIYRNGVASRSFHSGSTYLGSIAVDFDQASDFGTYQIIASNRAGQVASKIFRFDSDPVLAAPSFSTDLADLTLTLGESRTLGVVSSGHPKPTFAWFKDGTLIVGESNPTLSLQGTAADAGRYEVTASNSVGTARSAVARVTVLGHRSPATSWATIAPSSPPVRGNAIAFGHGRFVVVADGGQLLTSVDGLHWEHANIGTSASLSCVAFAADRFIAAGGHDRKTGRTSIYVSFDGTGWMPAESGTDFEGSIQAIAHGGDRFVAVDLRGSILTSSDGLRWQTGDWKIPNGEFGDAIAFGNDRFVITSRGSKVWTSTDGQSWVEHNSGVSSGLRSIVFGGGRFVAAGAYPDTRIDKAFIAISTDGATWTTSIAQSVSSPELFFLNGAFHLTGGSQDHLVSQDGAVWEQRNFTKAWAPLLGYGNGTYVALSPVGETFTSPNGLHWISTEKEVSRFSSAVFTNGKFLLFGSELFGGGMYSDDAVTWAPMAITGSGYNSATYGAGTWIAVSGSSGATSQGNRYIARSSDAVSWTVAMDTTSCDLLDIAYGAGRFVAAGRNKFSRAGAVVHSTDGASWTEVTTPGGRRLNGIAHGPGGFVAVGDGGTVLHSTDGLAWEAAVSGTDRSLWAVTYSEGKYIAVGGNGDLGSFVVRGWGEPFEANAVVCTSADGTHWSSKMLPFEEPLYSLAASNGTWLAGGADGLTVFSNDGTNWSPGPVANAHLWRMAAGKGVLVGTGPSFPSSAVRLSFDTLSPSPRFDIPPRIQEREGGALISFHTNAASVAQVHWLKGTTSIMRSIGTSAVLPSPAAPGVYFAEITAESRVHSRRPVVIAPPHAGDTAGDVILVQSDIPHPNGNIFDQYLLTGPSAQIRARPNRVSRISFRDLNEDIVQVEFSGHGALTLELQNTSAPDTAPYYNQDVHYVKGHAQIYISDADESTNVSVFSVGRITAVNQSLFKSEAAYDGVADIGLLAIHSRNGRFGGVRLGNASIWNRTEVTGFWAPDTTFLGPVVIGDISGFDEATAGLIMREATSVTIAGGDLKQANQQAVTVDGTPALRFSPGTDSHGRELPAQTNQATFLKEGKDVTHQLVP